MLDKDGEESALRTPQKAAAWRLVVQSPQQCDGGAPGKCATQVDLDPSSLVPKPTLPPHSLSTIIGLPLVWAGGSERKEYQAASISFPVWLSIHQIPPPAG